MNVGVRDVIRGVTSVAVAIATFATCPAPLTALPLAVFAVIGYQTLFDRTWGNEQENEDA